MHDCSRSSGAKRSRLLAAAAALLVATTPAAAQALGVGHANGHENGNGGTHGNHGSSPPQAPGHAQTPAATPAPGHGTTLSGNTAETSLPTWASNYDWSGGDGYSGWLRDASSGAVGYSTAQGLTGRAGLWVWPSGRMRYRSGHAGWDLSAPGTTRILSAVVQLQYDPRVLSHHCVDVALRDVAGHQRDGKRFCRPPLPPRGTGRLEIRLGDPDADPVSTELAIELELACNAPQARKPRPAHAHRRRHGHAAAVKCDKYIPPSRGTADKLRVNHVAMVLVDDDQPVPAPSGAWFDLRGQYIAGTQAYGLTLGASDGGSGVTRVAAEEVGAGVIATTDAPCDAHHRTPELGSRICPASWSADATVDATGLDEGRHDYRETATDVAGNAGASDTWSVFVDRTPPSLVSNFAAVLDPGSGDARVSWDSASDPLLRDGSPGSGMGGYSIRYRPEGGDWTDWQSTGETGVTVPDAHAGEKIDIEVRSVDNVGNISAPATATVIVPANFMADAGGPSVYAAGELVERNGDYVGTGRLDLLVGATDNDNDGVSQLSVLSMDGATIDQTDLDCALGCPLAPEQTFSVDTNALGEGVQTISVGALGADQARAIRPATQVFVDHTPPAQPVDAVVTDYDSAARAATVDWTNGSDPPLADGTPGAGRGRTLFRYQAQGGWSEWDSVDGGETVVGGLDAGDGFNVEIKSVDKVGNQSPTLHAHLTADDTVPEGMLERDGLIDPTVTISRVHRRAKPGARAHAAVNFTNCQPNLDDVYEQNAPPLFESFVAVKTVVNARLRVYCHSVDDRFDRIEIRAGLAIKTGDGTDPSDFTKVTGLQDPIVFKRPKRSLAVRYFNGPVFVCAPGWGGTRKYASYGQIKYIDDEGPDSKPVPFDTGRGGTFAGIKEPGPLPATCPTAPIRRLRELAGWDTLLSFGPGEDPDRARPSSPSSELRTSLGDPPYAKAGTKRAWDAHHTVPVSQPGADDMRELLFRCRIHPNGATNGVYLRGSGLLKRKAAYADLVDYDRRHDTTYHKRAYHGDTFGGDYVRRLRSSYLADDLRNNPETCSGDARDRLVGSLHAAADSLRTSTFGVEDPGH